jgi:primase-polymerase (primpol)-like protein
MAKDGLVSEMSQKASIFTQGERDGAGEVNEVNCICYEVPSPSQSVYTIKSNQENADAMQGQGVKRSSRKASALMIAEIMTTYTQPIPRVQMAAVTIYK